MHISYRYTLIIFLLLALVAAFVIACGNNKIDMPTGSDTGNNLGGAGDTTYIRLSNWSPETNSAWYQFNQPQDVIYGWDEAIYVADTGNNRILRYSKTGFFYEEDTIDIPEEIAFSNPTAIAQDVLLFIYAVNGTNQIFVHLPLSQYSETMQDTSIVFEGPASAQYVGIANDRTAASHVYLTDAANNRMLKVQFFDEQLVPQNQLADPTKIIASYGTGATTLNGPRQVALDDDMRIYWVQTCPDPQAVFFAQSMYWDNVLLEYRPELYVQFGTIGNRDFFLEPNDIAVRGQGAVKYVYIADTGHNLIRTFKFNNNQLEFQKPLLDDNGDTLFDHPMGVAIAPFDDDKEYVIYIADTNNNRIERYWLSVPNN